jgi:two-component system sensor histidine kinase KdpD
MRAPNTTSLNPPAQFYIRKITTSRLPPRMIRLLGPSAPNNPGWRVLPVGFALVVFLTVVGLWIEPVIKAPNLAILYMLAVVMTALRWGRMAATISAISGAVLFDYFFVPPPRTFLVSDGWYLITLVGLLTIGLLVSMLTLAAREEAQTAQRREEYTSALYSLTEALAAESDLDRILDAIERHLLETFQRPIIIWMPVDGRLKARISNSELATAASKEAAAVWVFENGEEAGCGTARFMDSRVHYLPLKTWKGVVGVLGLQADTSKEPASDEKHLLDTFANQAALAITRAILAQEAQRTAVLQETDKLQKALLSSISHNFRTPLASVIGALNSVLSDGALLDISTQRELLKTAQDEAKRLNRLVQNLLDMTRLEGGAVHVRSEPCDVQDVVGSALEQLGDAARERLITIAIPPDLPLVPMDFVLIVQVVVNLVDNSLKYSSAGAPIEVGASLKHDQLQIRVADRGRGIAEQDLERVFEKFFRGASAETPGGSGLGLSICKGLVEAHHGRIWAERRLNGGTEMIFSLPLEAQ